MSYYLIRTIESLITPPGLMFVMILTGLLIGNYFTRLARSLIFGGLLLLLIASLQATSLLAHSLLEADPPLTELNLANTEAQAIVVLGGGRYPGFEYHKETVSIYALERIRYGVWLHKQSNLPVLVTGGVVVGIGEPEAKLMAKTMTADFGVKPEWLEGNSHNTWENAKLSRQILQKKQINHILLVTHASHMRRAKSAFTRQGFTVTPAPLGFKSRVPLKATHFLPSAHAMSDLSSVFHELIGQAWYSLYY